MDASSLSLGLKQHLIGFEGRFVEHGHALHLEVHGGENLTHEIVGEGARRLPRVPEAREGLQRGLLHDVLRVRFGTLEAPTTAQHALAMPLEKRSEHPPFPGKHPEHQSLVI